MKKAIVFFSFVLLALLVKAQAPAGFKYQAAIRDADGEVISNQIVSLQFSILQGSLSGGAVYTESHQATTNSFGLVSLTVGGGDATSGSIEDIDWSGGPFFLQIELDATGGSDYTIMGVSELLSVPYALHSLTTENVDDADADATNEIQDLILNDNILKITDNTSATGIDLSSYMDNTDAQTLALDGTTLEVSGGNSVDLSVIQDGVIDDDADVTNEIQDLTIDDNILKITNNALATGINLSGYMDNTDAQILTLTGTNLGVSGGNSVDLSGLQSSPWQTVGGNVVLPTGNLGIGTTTPGSKMVIKGNNSDVLFGVLNNNGDTVFAIYQEGIRVNVGAGNKAVGSRGGFAVGNLAVGKSNEEFFRVTRDSVRISINTPSKAVGSRGGFAVGNLAVGKGGTNYLELTPKNYFIGHKSGLKTTGEYNTFFGYQSGMENISGGSNVFLGYQCGMNNTSGEGNQFMGNLSGFSNTTGWSNIFIGKKSGYSNIDGFRNIFIGYNAGGGGTTSEDNLFIGNNSGYSINDGRYNISIGDMSGYSITDGSYNTFVGYIAGQEVTTGYWNTFIGSFSGVNTTTGNGNTFVGDQSGSENTTGARNTYIGYYTGNDVETGSYNVYMGGMAGSRNKTGGNNVYVGDLAGTSDTIGWNNVFIGNRAGMNNLDGEKNVVVGSHAGYDTLGVNNVFVGGLAGYKTKGSNNVFLGNEAGFDEVGSNRLYIATNSTSNPLIYGEFDNHLVSFNAKVGVGTQDPKSKLDVDGGIKIGDDPEVASADKVGTIRYRADGNNSYAEMCMQVNSNTYEWVIIKQNTW